MTTTRGIPVSLDNTLYHFSESRDVGKTLDSFYASVIKMGRNEVLLPDLPQSLWDQLAEFERISDGSADNQRELAELRQALTDIQEIIGILNGALPQLGEYWDAQIFQELFVKARGGANDVLNGNWIQTHGALSELFGRNHEIGHLIAAYVSGDTGAIRELMGHTDSGGDYKPGKLQKNVDDIREGKEQLISKLGFLEQSVDGLDFSGAGVISTGGTDEVMASFKTPDFLKGVEVEPEESSEGDGAAPTTPELEFFSSAQLEEKLGDLEGWVETLDADKQERMRQFLSNVPLFANVINDALGKADPAQRSAYVLALLSGSGEVKISSDNAELNAQNVGRLLAAVLAGDTKTLQQFADKNHTELNEIVADFMKVEGEFRQTRDIKDDTGAAAKAELENTRRLMQNGESEEEREKRRQELAAARALWTAA